MSSHFTDSQWDKILALHSASSEQYGLPERRADSVIVGSFNIRKLGSESKRSHQSWSFLRDIVSRFDLIAIQEVMDDLSGLEHLHQLLGDDFGMVVSDITGAKPGKRGNIERLAFLFNWTRINRTALASDVTYDRTEIVQNLYNNRSHFSRAWEEHSARIMSWQQKRADAMSQGRRVPSKPPIELPLFVSFIRQPHCVSFRVPGNGQAEPYEFLVVNAHLLYGKNKREREGEFFALLEWLAVRAKYSDRLYHKNILLLGDLNLDFDNVPTMRVEIDSFLKGLNKSVLRSRESAKCNFPMLSTHPKKGNLVTALRQSATYDQIGIFSKDSRLPTPEDNLRAGESSGKFDYGVYNIAELISNALYNQSILEVSEQERKLIYKKSEYDISDHMPIWMRLRLPD